MATKMTYGEQLKHPNWQKKRLEVLSAYRFKCASCDSSEKTLHVHHKQYIKGRQAWDYPLDNFEALCVDCHEEVHKLKERLEAVIAQFPSSMWGGLADLLIGYGVEYVDSAFWLEAEGEQPRAGQLAWVASNLSAEEILEIHDCFQQMNPQGFLAAVRAAAREDLEGA